MNYGRASYTLFPNISRPVSLRTAESVGRHANIVARREVLADGHGVEAVPAGAAAAAELPRGVPHHLRVLAACLPRGTGVGAVVVPPPLVHPRGHRVRRVVVPVGPVEVPPVDPVGGPRDRREGTTAAPGLWPGTLMAAAGDSEASARVKAATQAKGDMVICGVGRFGEVCKGKCSHYIGAVN